MTFTEALEKYHKDAYRIPFGSTKAGKFLENFIVKWIKVDSSHKPSSGDVILVYDKNFGAYTGKVYYQNALPYVELTIHGICYPLDAFDEWCYLPRGEE